MDCKSNLCDANLCAPCTAASDCAVDDYCNLELNGGAAAAICDGINPTCADAVAPAGTNILACDAYLCNGSAAGCPIECFVHTDCVGTYYCKANGGPMTPDSCEPKAAAGLSCSNNVECLSNSCAGNNKCN